MAENDHSRGQAGRSTVPDPEDGTTHGSRQTMHGSEGFSGSGDQVQRQRREEFASRPNVTEERTEGAVPARDQDKLG